MTEQTELTHVTDSPIPERFVEEMLPHLWQFSLK